MHYNRWIIVADNSETSQDFSPFQVSEGSRCNISTRLKRQSSSDGVLDKLVSIVSLDLTYFRQLCGCFLEAFNPLYLDCSATSKVMAK